jgi:hypothetical protein
MKELEIEIDANGKVTVATKGYKGAACLDVVKALAQILGREESRELTPEFYEAHITGQTNVQQHQGR